MSFRVNLTPISQKIGIYTIRKVKGMFHVWTMFDPYNPVTKQKTIDKAIAWCNKRRAG